MERLLQDQEQNERGERAKGPHPQRYLGKCVAWLVIKGVGETTRIYGCRGVKVSREWCEGE